MFLFPISCREWQVTGKVHRASAAAWVSALLGLVASSTVGLGSAAVSFLKNLRSMSARQTHKAHSN